jgi:hypothetical protein
VERALGRCASVGPVGEAGSGAPLTKNVQGIEPPAQSIRSGDWLRSHARYPRESIHKIELVRANSDPGHSENQFHDTAERHRRPVGRDFPGDGQVRLRPRLGLETVRNQPGIRLSTPRLTIGKRSYVTAFRTISFLSSLNDDISCFFARVPRIPRSEPERRC